MIKKGKVAEVKGNKAKIVYEEINQMTPYIDIANHISDLTVNSTVIVAVYDDNFRTGAVIGVIT